MHGGAGGRAAFIMGGGSHVVVAIGGVLKKEKHKREYDEGYGENNLICQCINS